MPADLDLKHLKSYPVAEIKKHNKATDAWVTCGGYVHDITKFMTQHPGGADYLHQCLGADCEELMIEHGHSSFSYTLLKTYLIGKVEGTKQHQHHSPDGYHLRGNNTTDLEGLVDFEKATLPQIMALGDKYWPWMINRPIVRDNKLIIFSNSVLESLSHYPWYYIWCMWLPIILYNLWLGYPGISGAVSGTYGSNAAAGSVQQQQIWVDIVKCYLFSFFAGALTWTITEYVLHRFVFHAETWTPLGNAFHYFAHGIHHLIPTDSTRLTFPPLFGAVLGYLFHHLFRIVITSLVASPATLSHYVYFSGFLIGYCMYDTMHFFFHHTDFDNYVFRKLRAAHLNHHYKNEFANFGVSSPIWDFVFGTWDASAESKKE